MSQIALFTDSTADIPADLLEKYQVRVVPLYVLWGGEELRDGVDLKNADFYRRLPQDPHHPTTSQPTPADFAQALEESGADEAVIVTISDALSGTYDSAISAGKMVGMPVHVFDSRSVSMGVGFQVLAAARAREAGGDAQAMLKAAEQARAGLSVLFSVDTLDYLHKGGRIGGAARLLGMALQLKPMLEIHNVKGTVEAVERTRTRRKALDRIFAATFERIDPRKPFRLAVMHGNALAEAEALAERVRATYQPVELVMAEITPVLGIHGGPGTIGIGGHNI